MAKRESSNDTDDALSEALAQIESLQTAAADAEARAATAREEMQTLREEHALATARLADLEGERDSAGEEIGALQGELAGVRTQLREAAARYREARLAALPDVPHDLVPEHETIEEIEREIEAAQRLVSQVRERVQQEVAERERAARVPAGGSARRAPDLSALSPADKIKLGLQELDRRA